MELYLKNLIKFLGLHQIVLLVPLILLIKKFEFDSGGTIFNLSNLLFPRSYF